MIEYKLYEAGATIREVGDALGVPYSTMRKRFESEGIIRSRSEARKILFRTGKQQPAIPKGSKIGPFTEEHRARISAGRLAWGEKNAKGKYLNGEGYIVLTRGPNRGRKEHAVSVEEKIGRRLFRNECVHHLDGNRANNSMENLALMTNSEHMRLHNVLSGRTRLSNTDVLVIRWRLKKGDDLHAVASDFGIDAGHAKQIQDRYIWKHI